MGQEPPKLILWTLLAWPPVLFPLGSNGGQSTQNKLLTMLPEPR